MNNVNVERLRSVPVESIFGKIDPRIRITLGDKRQGKLRSLEQEVKTQDADDTLIAHLAREIWIKGRSRNELSRELKIHRDVIGAVLTLAGVPYPTHAEANTRLMRSPKRREQSREHMKARWQNPEYSAQMTNHLQHMWDDPQQRETQSKRSKKLWQDEKYKNKQSKIRSSMSKLNWARPGFREKMSTTAQQEMLSLWQDPEYIAMQSNAHKEGWVRRCQENPELLTRAVEQMNLMWQDPEFAKRIAEAAGRTMTKLHKDDEFNKMVARVSSEKWQNPNFRQRNAEGVRRARLDPDRMSKRSLFTIHGARSDIGFYAESAWEANVARVFMLLGREFYTREVLNLQVTDEYRPLFNFDSTSMTIDFVVIDPRGNMNLYEIMAYPKKDPLGWARLNMAIEQYPQVIIHSITPGIYRDLERRFKNRINTDSRFCGWEAEGDNLKTNPDKYQ